MELGYALAALGILAGVLVAGSFTQKRGADHPCTGCPNYSNCRAHVGCSNNSNRKKT